MRNDPPPLQARMPLLIGGSGEKRTLRIVARDADIWNGEGLIRRPTPTRTRSSTRYCAEIGRDPRGDPPDGRRAAGLHPADTREAAVDALAAILGRLRAARPTQARALGRELAAGRHRGRRRRGCFRAWRAAGAEEAIVDLPVPLDDETMERLAGPVRERLA